MAKGYCCLPLKANKYSLSENKENRGFSDSIMWGPVHNIKTNRNIFRRVCCFLMKLLQAYFMDTLEYGMN